MVSDQGSFRSDDLHEGDALDSGGPDQRRGSHGRLGRVSQESKRVDGSPEAGQPTPRVQDDGERHRARSSGAFRTSQESNAPAAGASIDGSVGDKEDLSSIEDYSANQKPEQEPRDPRNMQALVVYTGAKEASSSPSRRTSGHERDPDARSGPKIDQADDGLGTETAQGRMMTESPERYDYYSSSSAWSAIRGRTRPSRHGTRSEDIEWDEREEKIKERIRRANSEIRTRPEVPRGETEPRHRSVTPERVRYAESSFPRGRISLPRPSFEPGSQRRERWFPRRHYSSSGSTYFDSSSNTRYAADYSPPVSALPGSARLSVPVYFDSKSRKRSANDMSRPLAETWTRANTSLGNGTHAELLVINDAEHYTDEQGEIIVTLHCPSDTHRTRAPPNQIRWLHVQYTSDVSRILRNLVTDCPFVGDRMKSLGLKLLNDVCPQGNEPLARQDEGGPATVLRYDGRYHDDPLALDSVVFMSTPYILLHDKKRGGDYTMKSLLESHYGYTMEDSRDSDQVFRQSQHCLGKEIANTAVLRCLVLSPEVIITCGEIPLAVLRKGNIHIEQSDLRPSVTIRLTGIGMKAYYMVVKHDINFAELVARIQKLTMGDDFDIFKDESSDDPIRPEEWLKLLASSSSDREDLHLTLRQHAVQDSTYMYDSQDEDSRRRYRELLYYEPSPRGTLQLVPKRRHHRDRRTEDRKSRSQSPNTRQSTRKSSTQWALTRRTPPSRPLKPLGMEKAIILRNPRKTRSHRIRESKMIEPLYPPRYYVKSNPTPSHAYQASSASRTSRHNAMVLYSKRRPSMSNVSPRRRDRAVVVRRRTTTRSPDVVRRHHNTSHASQKRGNKIVNDEALQASIAHTYHLDWSSGRSSESEYSSQEQDQSDWLTDSDSSHQSARRRPSNVDKAAANDDSRHSIHSDDGHDEDGMAKSTISTNSAKTSKAAVSPFFTWRVTQSSPQTKDGDGSIATVVRLLKRVAKHLASDANNKKLYTRSHECTLEDLQLRHETLMQTAAASSHSWPLEDSSDYFSAHHEEAGKSGTSHGAAGLGRTSVSSENDGSRRSDLRTNRTRPRTGLHEPSIKKSVYVDVVEQAQELKRDLFGLSRGIVSLFVPSNGEIMDDDAKHVLDRHWGSLDSIFRLLGYSAAAEVAEGQQSWAVRDCNHLALSMSTCQNCRSGVEYSFEDALKHLHSNHLGRPDHDSYEQAPYDDPCSVWLRGTKTVTRGERISSLLETLEGFKQDLQSLKEKAVDLQWSVARPSTRKKRQGERRGAPEMPALPASLLNAFKNIMILHVIMARIVLLRTKEAEMNEPQTWAGTLKKISYGKIRYEQSFAAAEKNLHDAREELIMGVTEENSSAVTFDAVGAEYLVVMAMTNVQKGASRLAAAEKHGGADTSHDAEKNSDVAGGETIGVLDVYASHMANLQFHARQRPQRRVFLAIRALEEEVAALRRIAFLQILSLAHAARVIHPSSFLVTDTTRLRLYPLERVLLRRGQVLREREDEGLGQLEQRAAALRLQVKESIEVLDESHRKAIRVFTLVTLFFLPLSFISSFFGMNTSDIRDMKGRQTLYWSIAVPITIAVLGSAYMYAYKWDSVSLRMSNSRRSTSAYGMTKQRLFGGSGKRPKESSHGDDWGAPSRNTTWGPLP